MSKLEKPLGERSNSSSSISSSDKTKNQKLKIPPPEYRPGTIDVEKCSDTSDEDNDDAILVLKDFDNTRPQQTLQVSLGVTHGLFQHEDLHGNKDYDSAGEYIRSSYTEEQLEYKEPNYGDQFFDDQYHSGDPLPGGKANKNPF